MAGLAGWLAPFLLALLSLAKLIDELERPAAHERIWPVASIAVCLAALGVVALQTRAHWRIAGAARILSKSENPLIIPVLCALAGCTDGRGKIAREALVRLLPRLRVSDRDKLTSEQLAGLVGGLRQEVGTYFTEATDFAFAALRALEQVGGAEAVSVVGDIADAYEPAGRGPELKAAARSCMNGLRERIRQELKGQILLRPAESLESEILLRPAAGAQAGSELLLRPTTRGGRLPGDDGN